MNDLLQRFSPSELPLLARRRSTWLVLGLAVVVVVAMFSAFGGGEQTRHFTAKVQQGDIRDVVDSTGTVSAVTTVQVGSQVSGTISQLRADFNSRVKKGDIIATIAPELFQGALHQAVADLANSRANVLVAEANLVKAKSAVAQTKADFQRITQLNALKIESQQAVDLAKANYETAQAGLDAAIAGITQAQAQVRQKEAALAVARTNLDYTVIRSPIDGTVVARNVDMGQTVAASLQAPTIFTIAQDLTKMQVYTKVDESDVGRIRMGQVVTFSVDAFPREKFSGKVREVRMNPTRIQNVVTYDTIIDFDNPDLKLFPGMTAYVTIPVATVANVVKLPNAAIRYKPSISVESIKSLYAKAGIDEGSAPDGKGRTEVAVVWKLRSDGSLQPVKVALGITDHTFTEVITVLKGQLVPGDEVITSSTQSKAVLPGAQTQGGRR